MKKQTKKRILIALCVILVFLLAFMAYEYYVEYQSGIIREDFTGEVQSSDGMLEDGQDSPSANVFQSDILNGDDELPVCSGNEFGKTHEIIRHKNYTLCYCEKFEQSEWVAYQLTSSELEKVSSRKNNFHVDPAVSTGSATPADYKGSGYDRGHLAPAADMSFSEEAMDESFFMSNMSPQLPLLNRGLWLEMEKIERGWAEKYGAVYIVSGPVLNSDSFPTIGENNVAVPDYFYKILVAFDASSSKYVWIAYLAPNKTESREPSEFVSTVSHVEELTGIDFFPKLNGIVE
ncbi:MAG: DNA/RNA non-specific endonuclease [Treponemataceae bacterium]|nr:DNA/RNA non-specific endonuclease [Treponemataceae bacterium]